MMEKMLQWFIKLWNVVCSLFCTDSTKGRNSPIAKNHSNVATGGSSIVTAHDRSTVTIVDKAGTKDNMD